MTQQRPKDRPFFLYLCFHAPHEPIATPAEYLDRYPSSDDPKRASQAVSKHDNAQFETAKCEVKTGLSP